MYLRKPTSAREWPVDWREHFRQSRTNASGFRGYRQYCTPVSTLSIRLASTTLNRFCYTVKMT